MEKSTQELLHSLRLLELLEDDRDLQGLSACCREKDYVENEKQTGVSMKKEIYYNTHKGFVLVIVNFKFRHPLYSLDKGQEIEKIEKLFKNHGYIVKSYTNIDEKEILKKVKDFSNTKNIDRFICFLSSHGNETSLACPDGGVVLINDILSAANTKQLENKPKVFFIDACRMQDEENPRDRPVVPSTNYFIGYSCLPYTKSFVPNRKNSCGFYFKTLVEVFEDAFWRPPIEGSKRRNIDDLMAKVQYRVKKKYDEEGYPCQIFIYEPTLTGELFLHGYGEQVSKETELPKETEKKYMRETNRKYPKETKKTFIDENDLEDQWVPMKRFMSETEMKYPEETKNTYMTKNDLENPKETNKEFMTETDMEYPKGIRNTSLTRTDMVVPWKANKNILTETDMKYQMDTTLEYPKEREKFMTKEKNHRMKTKKKLITKSDMENPVETNKEFMTETDMGYPKGIRNTSLTRTDMKYPWKANKNILTETDTKYQMETTMEYPKETEKSYRKKTCLKEKRDLKADMIYTDKSRHRAIPDGSNVCVFL